ncbi:hypothetical protein SAMN05444005_102269 [Flavobacterium urocaniciphilum]|uniref:Uncharacterized protein n=2 Tax=Flavobacterium urocaniciphilum TaxID=1299341 RepID=A0A1H9API2_9FLAO|nr:hypothetical protein SAMN05444005_102269 [Flavobacterium urocaniciphilum]
MILFGCFSCKSYKEIKDKELVPISSKNLGEFHSVSNIKKKTEYKVSIQELFGINNLDSLVKVKINKNDEIEIHYKNVLGGNEITTYKGKFKKNYFEVFLDKKRIILPPFYCKNRVNRLRIGLSQNKELVINRHYDYSGMFMLFAAGNSDSKQYVFKSK